MDADGTLIVVELKRGRDARVHLQALTYAALVSSFSQNLLGEVYAGYLARQGNATTPDEALQLLIDRCSAR